MDQQAKLRPRKNPAQLKTGKPTHTGTRTCSPPAPAIHASHKSPPNLNQQVPTSPAPLVEPEDAAIVLDEINNERDMPVSTATADGAAAGLPLEIDANTPDTQLLPTNLAAFFKDATERFERMIRASVDSFISKLDELKVGMEASLEFERQRVNEMKTKQDTMDARMKEMEKEITELKSKVEKQSIDANKNERFSRRNNVRLVGIPEPQEGQREECILIAEDILRRKFNINSKVERAHRDGRRNETKPRHMLIKLLSYRDKVEVMRSARDALKNDRYFITDDLTPFDLQEKQKWVKQVQELYKAGTKMRFYAGKWRQLGGNPYTFD